MTRPRLAWYGLTACPAAVGATLDAIRRAGFSIVSVEHGELPKAPPFVRPLIVGTAS